MEPAAACNFQLANSWTTKPPAAWPPGFPAESESTEIYEYYAAAAAATQHYPIAEKEAQKESFKVVLHNMDLETYKDNPIRLFEEVAREFEDDIDMMKMKIHRYPESIRDLGDRYTVPRIVAIGPYHHSRPELKKAEQAKHVAAYHCIIKSDCSAQEMYDAVVSDADRVRHLYDEDAMADIGYDDYRVMMFYDACFLVQYMVWYTTDDDDKETDPSLRSFIYSHRSGINHDIWLLENQLPWSVVETVMRFRPVNLRKFVASWRDRMQDRQSLQEKDFVFDGSYDPPHLLGLLRHYIVGSRKDTPQPKVGDNFQSISFSISAIELAQIGITLKDNETGELADMRLKKGILFAELPLAALSLNYARASRLINMAAFEICTIPCFMDAKAEDSAVCSYLLLLSMLVHREEDVHKLRRQGILQGGAGLTDKQALDLFTAFQSLPDGLCCLYTMAEIQSYRDNRKTLTNGHAFWYKKKKTICKVVSVIVAFVPILITLIRILGKLN